MDDSLQRLNEIMKPYFDKKQQIEDYVIKRETDKANSKDKADTLRSDRLQRKRALEKELQDLRDRKDKYIENLENKRDVEIEEYMNNYSKDNFIYAQAIKRELQMEYNNKIEKFKEDLNKREISLIRQIRLLRSREKEEKEERLNLDYLKKKSDRKNVDLRELFEVKSELRKNLFAYKRELQLELEQEQINFNEAMLNLSRFKYEKDAQGRVINGEEWRNLYQEGDKISDKINRLRNTLKKVDESIALVQPTIEESNAIMKSMAPWEKEEYNRRKNAPIQLEDDGEELDNNIVYNEDVVDVLEDVKTPEYVNEDSKIQVSSKNDLLQLIYNEIIKEVKDLRTVRLNPSKGALKDSEYYISTKEGLNNDFNLSDTPLSLEDNKTLKLPNGDYINQNDFNAALKLYYDKNKGKIYQIKDKKYKINSSTIRKLKSKLKKCCALKLVRDNKISQTDIKRVYGKETTENLFRDSTLAILSNVNMPDGDYINKFELITKLETLFSTKKLEWLKNISQNIKEKIDSVHLSEDDEDIKQK